MLAGTTEEASAHKHKDAVMFKKSIVKTFSLAAVAVSLIVVGASTASAGNYGYGKHHGKSFGYVKVKPFYGFGYGKNRAWQKHVGWCSKRFKTYNSYDNTFRPYNGPRKKCRSPFFH